MEAPEYFHTTFCRQLVVDNKSNNNGNGDSFMVEDLLDFSNDDDAAAAAVFDNVITGNSTESSTLTVIDSSSNSSSLSGEPTNFSGELGGRSSFNEAPFSSDLYVPFDDLAVLEWQLSSFSEESFSTEDLQKLQLISGIKARPDDADPNHNNQTNNNSIFNSDVSIPAKARSKRSRAASANWTSRLLLHTPSESSPESSDVVVSDHSLAPSPPPRSVGKKTVKSAMPKKKERESPEAGPGDGRKCLHCATDKTPQWRGGPMGPKTLCNACGVRYKSGRLVPEYRPAASPTFVQTKHSNSHRKVLELRRQKEVVRAQQYVHHHHQTPPHHHHHYSQHHHNSNVIFDMNGGDYLIHQHVGPDFRQLI